MYMVLIGACVATIFMHWRTVSRWKEEAERRAEDRGFKKGYSMGMAYGRETAEFWKEEE